MINYKPILFIGMPFAFSGEDVESVQNFLQEKMSDYHVLAYHKNVDEVDFRVVYDKDLDVVDFNNLKMEILRSVEEKKNEKQD